MELTITYDREKDWINYSITYSYSRINYLDYAGNDLHMIYNISLTRENHRDLLKFINEYEDTLNTPRMIELSKDIEYFIHINPEQEKIIFLNPEEPGNKTFVYMIVGYYNISILFYNLKKCLLENADFYKNI